MNRYDRYWYTLGFLTLGLSLYGMVHYSLSDQMHLASFSGIVFVISVVRIVSYTIDR